MNIDVFNEALELRNKQVLCEDIMKYLSDADAVRGQKYKELLATFAKTFEGEFMMFVHSMGVRAGELFEELHDCCPECDCKEDSSDIVQTPPEDARFQLGDRVEVTVGIHNGNTGVVVGYNDSDLITYYVKLDKYANNPDALPMWFIEDILEPCSDETEEPTPIIPDGDSFEVGEVVKVTIGDYADRIGTIVGFDETDNSILVLLEEEDEPIRFMSAQLEKYTNNNNPDENEEVL